MPSELPERKKLFEGLEYTETIREPKGFHTLSFEAKTINVGGVPIQMNTDGWEELCQLTGTRSPVLMARMLIAFAYRYNHGLIGSEEEPTEEEPPTEKGKGKGK